MKRTRTLGAAAILAMGLLAGNAVSAERDQDRAAARKAAPARPAAAKRKQPEAAQQRPARRPAAQQGNRNTATVRGGNKVNVGSGNTNVNINVDNSKDVRIHNERNTTVRRNSVTRYNRPPYRYGGHRYYAFHPYRYHPYRPFYWGPAWHPWGFFVATLATTAIIVSVNNQHYHYDNGVYYAPSNGGYTVVQAPVGATVATIPSGAQTVVVNQTTNNYYYGGAYYEKGANGYTVVPATAGTVVDNLPEGGTEVKIGDQTYVKVGDTYYQPSQVDGKDVYEVVQVEDGD